MYTKGDSNLPVKSLTQLQEHPTVLVRGDVTANPQTLMREK